MAHLIPRMTVYLNGQCMPDYDWRAYQPTRLVGYVARHPIYESMGRYVRLRAPDGGVQWYQVAQVVTGNGRVDIQGAIEMTTAEAEDICRSSDSPLYLG